MIDLTYLKSVLEQKKGQRQLLQKQLQQAKKELKQLKQRLEDCHKARELVRTVAVQTQQQLQIKIAEIVTLAMQAIFDDPYGMCVGFVQRRGKTECDLLFERDGNKINPLEASGGGAVDVAAFALRVASLLMLPQYWRVLILDEPFRYLSNDLLPRAAELLKQLSQDLGIQFIVVTHSPVLTECADKVFMVRKDGVSTSVRDIGIHKPNKEE